MGVYLRRGARRQARSSAASVLLRRRCVAPSTLSWKYTLAGAGPAPLPLPSAPVSFFAPAAFPFAAFAVVLAAAFFVVFSPAATRSASVAASSSPSLPARPLALLLSFPAAFFPFALLLLLLSPWLWLWLWLLPALLPLPLPALLPLPLPLPLRPGLSAACVRARSSVVLASRSSDALCMRAFKEAGDERAT